MKVRIITGPNGSGKSTLLYSFQKELKLKMGFIVNADEIERQLNTKRVYEFDKKLKLTTAQLHQFITESTINKKENIKTSNSILSIEKNEISLTSNKKVNSYVCAAIADFLRTECLLQKIDFSFESVFSDAGKVNFVSRLKDAGFEIYFYFVCTINASINVARVKERVANNGHNVSEEKIISRYQKSIDNAIKAKPYTKRFFVIDNSQEYNPVILLETENNKKTNYINKTFFPNWAEPFKINN